MRVVIVGCGRLGSLVARGLDREGHQVTVIDRQADAFQRLGTDFGGETVLGTGIDEDVLREARIEQADAFVAASDSDTTNIMAAQVAKEIFGIAKVVARIYEPQHEEIYRSLGIDTISPTAVGARLIREALAGTQRR
jgi:trk system potassium uptake protein TrkA